MHEFFVFVSHDYDYAWQLIPYTDPTGKTHEPTATEILEVQHNVGVDFICNYYIANANGDLYRIIVADEKDEFFFLLKTGFKKINPNKDYLPRYVYQYL